MLRRFDEDEKAEAKQQLMGWLKAEGFTFETRSHESVVDEAIANLCDRTKINDKYYGHTARVSSLVAAVKRKIQNWLDTSYL